MKEQITIEELLALEPGSYLLYDMRDRYSFDYGAIPGAEHKEQAAILEAADSLPKDMPVIICCKSGLLSDAVAEELRTHGLQAMNLQGGYYGYLALVLTESLWRRLRQAPGIGKIGRAHV